MREMMPCTMKMMTPVIEMEVIEMSTLRFSVKRERSIRRVARLMKKMRRNQPMKLVRGTP